LSPDDSITMISKDQCSPYSLAALPYLVSGKLPEDNLWISKEKDLQHLGCDFISGKEVIEVQPNKGQLVYKDGGVEDYDTLLIASGAEPTKAAIDGINEVSPLYFHTFADYKALQQQLESKKNITIYGGGLVAVELAVALLEAGHEVRIVVRSRVLRRYFDHDVGNIIENIIADKGAQIYKGQVIKRVNKKGNKIEVAFPDETGFDTDIIVVALGVKPATSFLEGSGINLDEGIIADRKMRTNVENIYVAGDAAKAPDFFTGDPGLSLVLPTAVDQAKVAACNMVGQETEYEGWLSTNILNFLGHSAVSIGMSVGDEGQILKEEKNNTFKKMVYKDGRLVGVSLLDVDTHPGVLQYLIKKKIDISLSSEALFETPKDISCKLMLENENRESSPVR
jgi:NAD(P)H-nitrite reductase large subunit